MNYQRLIIAFLITLGLISSVTSAAFSQGRMAGGHSITICSPDGSHDIIIGANNQPVPSAHECEDCCLVALDAPAAPTQTTPAIQKLSRATLSMTSIAWLTRTPATANARAPPE